MKPVPPLEGINLSRLLGVANGMLTLLRSVAADSSLPGFYRDYAHELVDAWDRHNGKARPPEPAIVIADDLCGEPAPGLMYVEQEARTRGADGLPVGGRVASRIEAIRELLVRQGEARLAEISRTLGLTLQQTTYALSKGPFARKSDAHGAPWGLAEWSDGAAIQQLAT